MVDRSFFRFLEAALGVLEKEVPLAHEALRVALEGTDLRITVDGVSRFLSVEPEGLRLFDEGNGTAELETRREVLVALLDARRSLFDAVLSDELMLRGAPDRVAALHDALVAFIQGAVRSPSMPALLATYTQQDAPQIKRPRANLKISTSPSHKKGIER